MKLVSYQRDRGEVRVGALNNADEVVELADAELRCTGTSSGRFRSMQALIEAGEEGLEAARGLRDESPPEARYTLADLGLCSPLPVPARLRDAGLFLEHLDDISREMARLALRASPDVDAIVEELEKSGQLKAPDVVYRRVCYYNGNHHSVIGPGAPLRWPMDVEVVDYELELGVVVGRKGYNLTADQSSEYVFGYTLMNDWSARDLQLETMGSVTGPSMGKDFATSLGPCIVTRDELPDPHVLEMVARVDGEVWSRGSTKNMHHSVFDALAQLSRISPLVPGEVIGSGTPASGSALEQGRRLQPGQTVELSAAGIGALANPIVRSRSAGDGLV